MKIEIENLKGLVYLKDLNNYQRSLAINEFNRLVDYVNELEQLTIPVVACRFLSADEKVEQFKKELKALLVKFDAELAIEEFGRDWSSDEKIVVNFNWDEDLANRTENGMVPDWVIGRWENGR